MLLARGLPLQQNFLIFAIPAPRARVGGSAARKPGHTCGATGEHSLSAIRMATVERWFSPEFAEKAPELVDDIRQRFIST